MYKVYTIKSTLHIYKVTHSLSLSPPPTAPHSPPTTYTSSPPPSTSATPSHSTSDSPPSPLATHSRLQPRTPHPTNPLLEIAPPHTHRTPSHQAQPDAGRPHLVCGAEGEVVGFAGEGARDCCQERNPGVWAGISGMIVLVVVGSVSGCVEIRLQSADTR